MGHAGASRKSPNDVPWETPSLRLSRPISAPLLTAVGHGDTKKKLVVLLLALLDLLTVLVLRVS